MTKLFLDIDNPYANNTMYNDIMHSDSYSLPTANLSHCAVGMLFIATSLY